MNKISNFNSEKIKECYEIIKNKVEGKYPVVSLFYNINNNLVEISIADYNELINLENAEGEVLVIDHFEITIWHNGNRDEKDKALLTLKDIEEIFYNEYVA